MKTLLFQLLFACLLLPQCTTTPDGATVFDGKRAIMVVEMTVPSATRYAVAKKPEAAAPLIELADAIDRLATDGTVAPKDLARVSELVKQKITDPDLAILIDGVVDVITSGYNATYADAVAARLGAIMASSDATAEAQLGDAALAPVLRAVAKAVRRGAGS